tara:strand:+ start:3288 stop:3920 length:633 start_codon:yes stop_codon:yes gene_type:complete
MSEMRIVGGANYAMLVTENGFAKVQNISEEIRDHAASTGIEQKFNINSLDITITNDTETSLLYVLNGNVNYDLVCSLFIYNMGNSAGPASSAVDCRWRVIRNPTVGDIITNANDCGVGPGPSANQNTGSTKILQGSFFKGASGETAFSDGDVTISTRSASHTGRIPISLGNYTIAPGTAVGVNYLPPTGNTSQIVEVAMACYLKNEKVGL